MADVYDHLAKCIGFDWDKWNTRKIWDKHKVTPSECEQPFFNRPFIVDNDERHSKDEIRFYALGQTDAGRLLFIVFTIRGHLIRAISVRDMSKREREDYKYHEKQNP